MFEQLPIGANRLVFLLVLAFVVAAVSARALQRIALRIGLADLPGGRKQHEGAVPVTCQRCLSDFALAVERRTVAVLARSEKEADELDASSDHEVVVADHPLDAVELVEDELLLSLPYAPMHEAGACSGPN